MMMILPNYRIYTMMDRRKNQPAFKISQDSPLYILNTGRRPSEQLLKKPAIVGYY